MNQKVPCRLFPRFAALSGVLSAQSTLTADAASFKSADMFIENPFSRCFVCFHIFSRQNKRLIYRPFRLKRLGFSIIFPPTAHAVKTRQEITQREIFFFLDVFITARSFFHKYQQFSRTAFPYCSCITVTIQKAKKFYPAKKFFKRANFFHHHACVLTKSR